MIKYILSFIILGSIFVAKAQELNAKVVVDYQQVNASNPTMFKDLERDLTNFINSTKWTNDVYLPQEKIDCTFRIIIREFSGSNTYKATLQIQARRPIYNSIYFTPILNFQDERATFNYTQNQQILFNIRSFSGTNLPELIAYYAYLILGYDGDSFEKMGGTNAFNLANQIADLSFNQGFEGWEPDGSKSRKLIVSNIFLKDLEELRNIWYTYHRLGLDLMQQDVLTGKKNLGQALIDMDKLKVTFTNNYNVLDMFIYLKLDEIRDIFSQGGNDEFAKIDELKKVLKKLSPAKGNIWNKLQ